MIIKRNILVAGLWVVCTSSATVADSDHARDMAASSQLFSEKIRPFLTEHCVKCHGGEKIKSNFNLGTREGFLKGGDQNFGAIPGQGKTSPMVKSITHEAEPHMPPKKPPVEKSMVDAIVRWIDLGAAYDKPLVDGVVAKGPMQVTEEDKNYWAFRPLAQPDVPVVRHDAWPRTPIDRFLLRRMEDKGVGPGPEADRRALIRRAWFDLVGLPPEPEDVEAFVNAPDFEPAWEAVIDRLLASPHFGERWARHWLDPARFAESHGFEHDYDRKYAYHFRDFVIKAFNMDMPYDQFLRWQLAGDELAPDDPLAMMATGFMGAGVYPTQITTKEAERVRYDAMDDMLATTGSAMLALTIGCARCHDHKYDPIPVRNYYEMLSAFTTTVRSEIDLDLAKENTKEKYAAWESKHKELKAELARFEKENLEQRFGVWLKERPVAETSAWLPLDYVDVKSRDGATFTKQDDGSYLSTGKNPPNDEITVTGSTDLKAIAAVRLEALPHGSLARNGPGRSRDGNFVVSTFTTETVPAAIPVPFVDAVATFSQSGLSIKDVLNNKNRNKGWAIHPRVGRPHHATFITGAPVSIPEDNTLRIVFSHTHQNTPNNVGRFRLLVTDDPGLADKESMPDTVARVLNDPEKFESLNPKQKQSVLDWYKARDAEWGRIKQKLAAHNQTKPVMQKVKVQVTSEGFKPMRHHVAHGSIKDFYEPTYYLKRGDANQKDGEAPQGFLEVLTRHPDGRRKWIRPRPEKSRTSYRRTGLANWITDPEFGAGDLAARVMVNRLWHYHMGRGIVGTLNDFGFQGDAPSHPGLLEWLAADLVDHEWKLKRLHKMIMMSRAYRISDAAVSANQAIDPDNRYFWRWNKRRMEAEIVRDNLLAVSGTLDRTLFGPGTLNEGMKRRSIYFNIKRSKLIPFMQVFDWPDTLTSTGVRTTTIVAPQALLFMNNPHVKSYAEAFAQRVKKRSSDAPDRMIVTAYELAFSRPPSPEEIEMGLRYLAEQENVGTALNRYCQVLMSLNEFIYIR